MKHILCNIELKQRIENSKIEKKIISTGLDELDDALDGGFQGGNLYVLSGDVCTGKHALLQSILCNSIENGTNNIVYFSFCYDCYGVLQRLLHKSGENKTIKCAYFPEYRRVENIRKNN